MISEKHGGRIEEQPERELTPEEAEAAGGGGFVLTQSTYYADPANLAQLDPNTRMGVTTN